MPREEPRAALQSQASGASQQESRSERWSELSGGMLCAIIQHFLFSTQILQLCVLSWEPGQRDSDPGTIQDENV